MKVAAHPVPCRTPVRPEDLASGEWLRVAGGAVTADAQGDALVKLDDAEVARRATAGIGAVTNLSLLDALLCLPLGVAVRTRDLGQWSRSLLKAAPRGVVDTDRGWVIRRLSPPLTVVAAIVEGAGWRRPFVRAASFAPFCQRIALLPRTPRGFSTRAWEAAMTGVGVWLHDDAAVTEVIPPQPFSRNYWKPAGWAFHEGAYRVLLDNQSHLQHGGSL